MTATEVLRRMLDERGVEWDELPDFDGGKMTRWRDSMGRYVTAYDDGVMTCFADFYWGPTPQQAIEATLGRGTCHKLPQTSDAICVVHRGDFSASFGYWTCSECGAECFEGARYCMNCGAEVVE